MEQQQLNKEWLIRRTGDPFADLGGAVISFLMREQGSEDAIQLIDYAAKIYVNDWKGKLNAFFLNSTITQPAFKGERKLTETKKFFKALIQDELPFEEGYCRILGEKTKLFAAGRSNHILSGSGTFVNFHHTFQGGVMLSKEALIRMFFVPLGCVQLSDKIALLNSNNDEVLEYFVAENVRENSRRIASRIVDGITKSPFRSPSSALFDFALRWIQEAKDIREMPEGEEAQIELTLYHFTNFGASPEVVLYRFSAALFTFYAKVQHRDIEKDWHKFACSSFYAKGAKYEYETATFEVTDKKEVSQVAYDDFKTWRNRIYDRLLNGESILDAMLRWVAKKRSLDFRIVKLHQIILRDMDEKTLQIIERIADYVLEDSSNIKKSLRSLQGAKKAHAFRRVLLSLEAKNLKERKPDPLFSLEEYALELFPEGRYWQEIQNLLLVAIYQKMHEQQIWLDGIDLPIEDTEEETIES